MSISSRKKVLIVHHGKGIGGAPKSMSYLARRLVEDGHQVEVLFLQNSSAIELMQGIKCKVHVSKLPIYYFYHMSNWVKLKYFYKAVVQLLSINIQFFLVAPYYLNKIKPDIVYINTSVLPEWTIVSWFFRKRVVVHIRETTANGYFGVRRNFLRFIYSSFPDQVISISKLNLNALGLIASDHVEVIYNYERVEVVKRDNYSKNYLKVYDFFYLGGESDIKGWSFIRKLLETDIQFKIAIGGAFSLQVEDELIEDPRVNYLGVIKNISDYMSESYFLISPFKEPHFSRPIIEAYAYGCVPIASNLIGIEEQLENFKTGLLFDSEDINDFFEKIRFSLSLKNTKEFYKILNAGKCFFEKNFSIENEKKIVDKIIKF